MKLGIDLDGVCAEFQYGWAQRYNEWFGTHLTWDDLQSWNSFLNVTRFETPQEFWEWIDAVPGFWMNLDPIPGAMGGLWQLQQAGHELHFITSRRDTGDIRAQSAVWLMEHAPNELPVNQRFHVVNGQSKTVVDCQVYIDDSPSELAKFKAEGRQVIRFDQPWNKPSDGGILAKGWGEVVRIIELMS